MTLIRTIRDIVIPIAEGTHTIEEGTYFYVNGDEAEIIVNGACIRIPEVMKSWKEDTWLFVGEDIEIPVQPIGGGEDVIPF